MRRVFQIIMLFFVAWSLLAQGNESTRIVKDMYIPDSSQIGIFGNLVNYDATFSYEGHITMKGDSLQISTPLVGGVLELSGEYDQHITGQGLISVDTLILDNSYNVSFDNDIVINDYLSFVDGILYDIYSTSTDPKDLPAVIFGDSASYDTTQVSNSRYVEGMVRKRGRTRFIFPIGDGDYFRPVIADGIKKDTTISAHYFYEWIDFPEEKMQLGIELYRDEYWYVSGAEKDYDLTLTYSEETSTFDTDDENIRIVSFNEAMDSRYRLLEPEVTEVMEMLSYMPIRPERLDSAYVWYGFARVKLEHEIGLFIPQILSPNGDGRNDKFVIGNLHDYPNNRLVIFNRYGDVLYEMENYDNSWDGRVNVNVIGGGFYPLPSGTYFVFFYHEGELIYKDFVQLLRSEQ